MNEELKLIRIGDFAKLFNVSIKTVRYYESVGLIVPAFVDVYSGYRYFDFHNIERMQEILSLKELGFSLDEIKNFKEEESKVKLQIIKIELNSYINKLSHWKFYLLKD